VTDIARAKTAFTAPRGFIVLVSHQASLPDRAWCAGAAFAGVALASPFQHCEHRAAFQRRRQHSLDIDVPFLHLRDSISYYHRVCIPAQMLALVRVGFNDGLGR
jgi:hypothetical protein